MFEKFKIQRIFYEKSLNLRICYRLSQKKHYFKAVVNIIIENIKIF